MQQSYHNPHITLTSTVVSLLSLCSRYYLIPESNANGNGGLLFIIAVANAAIFIVLIIIMTVVLVLLFKYRCYKVVTVGWSS